MFRLFTNALAGVALVTILAAPASAQQPTRPVSGGDDATMLFGAGLTFMNISSQTGVGVGANALFNTFKTAESGRFGIVGDFGLNDFDGGTVVTVMGGVRYTFETNNRLAPYGQFLAGITHCCGDTDFSPAIGFGTDYAFTPKLNLRGEVQWILEDSTATRFFLGVSLPIAKRR